MRTRVKESVLVPPLRFVAVLFSLDAWLQQQVEALLVAYNASQQAARRKARLAIAAMRRQSEENGNATMTLDDINNEIRQSRKARKVAV